MSKLNFEKKQIVFLFARDGEKLSFKNDNLVVTDKEGKIKHQSTCWRVFALFIVGNTTITTGLIQRAKKFCFPIVLMTQNLKVYDILGFQAEGNTLLRKQQYACSFEFRLEVAKKIVANKIVNQRYCLLKQRYRSDDVNETIAYLKEAQSSLSTIVNIQSLMGIEGAAARNYFGQCFNNCDWTGRKPRSKQDYINSTLDIGYMLLFNYVEALLRLYGFDLYCAYLHQEFYMRKSLVCDIVEPFRPLIDYRIRKAISLGQCNQADFEERNGSWYLKRDANKPYVLFLLEPIIENKVHLFRYVQDFYRAIAQEYNLEKFPSYLMK